MFEPVGAFEPLVVNLVKAAVILDLFKKIVEKFEKVRVIFTDGPGERFGGKGFVQKDQFVRSVHDVKNGDAVK